MSDRERRAPKDLDEMSPGELFRQLTDGSGRWPFTVLAVLGIVAVVMAGMDPGFHDYVPLVSDATTAIWVVAVVTLIWCALAVVNWRARR